MKFKIKRGDEVVVIAGAHKGKRGKVLQVIPATQRVVVEGVAMLKHHTRKTDKTEGGIIEREGSVHYSNVKKADAAAAPKGKSAKKA